MEQATEIAAVARGIILQASYRIQNGVPVVHLFGVLEDGGTFLVRDRRQVPHFFVLRRDAERAHRLGATRQFETAKKTFAGETVVRVDVAVPADTVPLRERLHRDGVATFEADVRFAVRYLIDRDIRGGCEIRGAFEPGERIARVYDAPELRPAAVALTPSVLSFDIETDPRARRLLAIAVYGMGIDEVYIVEPEGREMPVRAVACADERVALNAFVDRIQGADPDILTGWNVIDFDLNVLNRIAKRVRVPLDLGREPGAVRLRSAQGYFGSGQASIPGRLVLDGMDLVRGAFMRFDDYSLNAVATEVLGEGKVEMGAGDDRAADILGRYRDDLETFAEYARTDARLALEIVDRLDLVNLALARSRLTGMTPDRVSASIASFDFRYLSALRRRRIVAPTVGSDDARVSRHQAGGHVFEPTTGIHENVWVFDFKSLYPSVIRTFNIDPLGYSANPDDEESEIRLAPDAAFRRDEAILPTMLDELFPQREEAKRQGDAVASQAIKILMNSFYGVLGTPACRFHNVAIANAVTGMGRHFLQWSKAWFEEKGYDVLYGDTDSVFVRSGLSAAEARTTGSGLAGDLNRAIAAYTRDKWQVESRLEMEFEKLYLKLFLPSLRHGASGARKRYAGLIDGHADVEFTGMEVVRRDWTDLAKDVQRELYKRLFAGEPVEDYLARVATALRNGELDDMLVYRKGLRKNPAAYTANTPPHVAAARKSSEPGRVIAYLITVAGPEPLDALDHEPDREHYLDKQVRPVAEPVLAALGLDFDRVIGDDKQMTLF
ncbi:MAG: DNA polymerase II [Gammaproteobacteria bacterium]|nr:DNA polymerase II [Gammaproteobacteria bacterium]MYK47648.1 DNA polymerase II [Gammaproteobacteria bacterium]